MTASRFNSPLLSVRSSEECLSDHDPQGAVMTSPECAGVHPHTDLTETARRVDLGFALLKEIARIVFRAISRGTPSLGSTSKSHRSLSRDRASLIRGLLVPGSGQ